MNPDGPNQSTSTRRFAYVAQTFAAGAPVTGTIDALDLQDAAQRLGSMQLRIIRIDPVAEVDSSQAAPTSGRQLSRADFTTFNQQLAQLAGAGLPIEQGLRLIAEDLESGRLASTIALVSADLDRGVSIEQAIANHESQFPPLYATVVRAGIRSGRLPGVLLSVGRHLELVERLRSTLWRAAAYPLMVLVCLLVVLILLGRFVLPTFRTLYSQVLRHTPPLTQALFLITDWMPFLIGIGVAILFGIPLVWSLLRAAKLTPRVNDMLRWLPLLGPILRRGLIVRWADGLKLAIDAGLGLPEAIELASDIVGSPAVRSDGLLLKQQLLAGQTIGAPPEHLRVLPTSSVMLIGIASESGDVARAINAIARMHEQQAYSRLAALQSALAPLMILGVAGIVTLVILGLLAPMISLFNYFG